MGALSVVAFTLSQNHGRPTVADLYLFAALLLCAAGYAEGGRLTTQLARWRVIAWAVVLAAPVCLGISVWALRHEPVQLTPTSLGGLAYLALVSQFFGFVLWYRGMALIGVARASVFIALNPLSAVLLGAALLGEQMTLTTLFGGVLSISGIVAENRQGAAAHATGADSQQKCATSRSRQLSREAE